MPKYTEVWDIAVVINYVLRLLPNSELTLKELSLKLVILMAVTNADRASDIKSLDISTLSYSPEGATFKHKHPKKISRPGYTPDSFYAAYAANQNICVVRTIKDYVQRTADIRVSNRLVISYIRPHKEVCTSTILRWILEVLHNAGIDTSVFRSHSTRSATATAASSRGVSSADIMRSADWTTESTFTRFYYRRLLLLF